MEVLIKIKLKNYIKNRRLVDSIRKFTHKFNIINKKSSLVSILRSPIQFKKSKHQIFETFNKITIFFYFKLKFISTVQLRFYFLLFNSVFKGLNCTVISIHFKFKLKL